MDAPAALVLSGVEKRYGDVVALAGVDLSIRRGEVVALLGPNGAGKTTLLSLVAGLRRPDAGSVKVLGVDAFADPRRARSSIGFAPQDLGIYPTATVQENLLVFAELAGLRGAARDQGVARAAQHLGLTKLLGRPARLLSGGERRRLHVAMAFVHGPSLLLLDEPGAGMDVRGARSLEELVRTLAEDGAGVCYSTNDLLEAESVADSVAILDRGRLMAHGAVADLVTRHGAAGSVPPVRSGLEDVFHALTGRPYAPHLPHEREPARAP